LRRHSRDRADRHSRLDAASLPGRQLAVSEHVYDERRTILYALATGMARDPLDPAELPFVTEPDLHALPGLATVIAWNDGWLAEIGLDLDGVVHGEQRITLHRPLPPSGRVRSEVEIVDAFDKGVGRAAVLYVRTMITEIDDGRPLATLHSTVFARFDGGFGGPPGNPPPLSEVPERPPDLAYDDQTLPSQALIYRLLGDRNPLHADPDFARQAGFSRPILHGLCTFGFATNALVRTAANGDSACVVHVEARFTAPVYPGERLRTEIWHEEGGAAFRTLVPDDDRLVLDRGKVLLRA
jgi:acyl dehydratase